jgi:hypothetical protein
MLASLGILIAGVWLELERTQQLALPAYYNTVKSRG